MAMPKEEHDFRKTIFLSFFSNKIGFVWNEMQEIILKKKDFFVSILS